MNMSSLFMTAADGGVLPFVPTGPNQWRCFRVPPGPPEIIIVLWHGPDHLAFAGSSNMAAEFRTGWLVCETSDLDNPIIIKPVTSVTQSSDYPPLGSVWQGGVAKNQNKRSFSLLSCAPPCPQIETPVHVEWPSATLHFSCSGNLASTRITIFGTLDQRAVDTIILKHLELMRISAQREDMANFITLDLLKAPAVSWSVVLHTFQHMQREGMWNFIVTRGCAVLLNPRTFTGSFLLATVKLVLRLKPLPCPLSIVPTNLEADPFLSALMHEHSKANPEVRPSSFSESPATLPAVVCATSNLSAMLAEMKSSSECECPLERRPTDPQIPDSAEHALVTQFKEEHEREDCQPAWFVNCLKC